MTTDKALQAIRTAARKGGRFEDILDRVDNRSRGSLKTWAHEHLGTKLETLQVTLDADSNITGAWQPGGRTLDTARATYATLDGSREDYKGNSVIHADDQCIAFTYQWGDDTRVVFWYIF